MPPFAAEIDLAAIRANVAELGRRAGDAEVMAVVKADGQLPERPVVRLRTGSDTARPRRTSR